MAEVLTTGNTLLPPPRLTGDPAADLTMLQRWFASFYDQIAKVRNVTGTLADHEARISALEKKVG